MRSEEFNLCLGFFTLVLVAPTRGTMVMTPHKGLRPLLADWWYLHKADPDMNSSSFFSCPRVLFYFGFVKAVLYTEGYFWFLNKTEVSLRLLVVLLKA